MLTQALTLQISLVAQTTAIAQPISQSLIDNSQTHKTINLPKNVDVPVRHGIVFFCPNKPDDAVRELEKIKTDGFKMIKFSSWVWTLPKSGSDLERTAKAVLDWCDRNEIDFFLLHNIQWGSAGEGAGLDKQVLNPDETAPLLEDWARVLKGHSCVMGVILGNEVGPSLGTPKDAPRLWSEFRLWLATKHGTVDKLNEAWRTTWKSFDEVNVPPKDSPGWIDVRRYANQRFGQFYGYLFEHNFRPALGEKLYGEKTTTYPFVHRACIQNTMTCWDDMLSMYPLWRIKCAADTTGKPMFNGELHLYHDDYGFNPSVERSRYRYFTSALLGEYLTASFAWGQWNKPNIVSIHSATPSILADVVRVARWTKMLAAGYQTADLMALVNENNYATPSDVSEETDYEQRHPLGNLYAQMGATGKPWRYVLDEDVRKITNGTLVVWTTGLSEETARAIVALPPKVRVLAYARQIDCDEYGRPLPTDIIKNLKSRAQYVENGKLKEIIGVENGLPEEYTRVVTVKYPWWSPKRGHYGYDIPYCELEARYADTQDGRLVAVINNTEKEQTAPVPWGKGKRVRDIIADRELTIDEVERQVFGPLAVKLFLCK